MADHKIVVTATPDVDGKIKVRTDIMGQTMSTVMDTRERLTRQALVALGWTPPEAPAAADYEEPTAVSVEYAGKLIDQAGKITTEDMRERAARECDRTAAMLRKGAVAYAADGDLASSARERQTALGAEICAAAIRALKVGE